MQRAQHLERGRTSERSPQREREVYELLAACARPTVNNEQRARILELAQRFESWDTLAYHAELHGMGSLLYAHLRDLGVEIPRPVKRSLQGLYLRNRYTNEVRFGVLRDVLGAFEAAGLRAILLKGAALAHLIYPEPGLRPMSDVDIWVDPGQAAEIERVLDGMGFHLAPPGREDHHLLSATLHTSSITVCIEVHRTLLDQAPNLSLGQVEQIPLRVGEVETEALGYHDMLWHLCQHLSNHTIVFRPLRLIWMSDIAGWAARFVDEIRWDQLREQRPIVPTVLGLVHAVVPLDQEVLEKAALDVTPPPEGAGESFRGWPFFSLAEQRREGKPLRAILRDTFVPSEWWLRLHYGIDSRAPLLWYRWVRHPASILGWIANLALGAVGEKLGRPRPIVHKV